MAKVYIAHDNGHGQDFSDAKRFGDLVTLTKDAPNIFSTEWLLTEIKDGLSNFGPEDYLLIAGNSVVALLAYAVLSAKLDVVRVLLFSFNSRKYEMRSLHRSQFQTREVGNVRNDGE